MTPPHPPVTYVHIHAPQPTEKLARAATCPDCKRRTRMLCFFTPWYGWDSTCIRCGRHWSDGEWMPLPFERAARQKSIDRARKRFRRKMAQEVAP
jgi:hypothetical protein